MIIDWAVDERGIHRVEWRVSSANEAGIAVARRLGTRKDGVLRESYLHRGGGPTRRSGRCSHRSGGRPRASVAHRDLEQQRRALAQGALELERAAEGLGPVSQADEP